MDASNREKEQDNPSESFAEGNGNDGAIRDAAGRGHAATDM